MSSGCGATVADRWICTGRTRTWRLATCWGDGAKAIPVDPSHLGFGPNGQAIRIDADGDIYACVDSWIGFRTLAKTCQDSGCHWGISDPGLVCVCVSSPIAPEPWAPPYDYPRPPFLLAVVRGLAVDLAPHGLAVHALSFSDEHIGSSAWVEIEHVEGGGRGHCVLRRAWGETHVQDFAGVPAAVIDLVRWYLDNLN